MSDSNGVRSVLEETRDVVVPDPLHIMQLPIVQTGWTEWYRYESGRFRETVVYRRHNPFWFLGVTAVAWLIMYGFLNWFSGIEIPGPVENPAIAISTSSFFGYLPLVASVFIAASVAAGVWTRINRREEEQFDRDQMYPPKGYWEEGEEGAHGNN